MTPSRTERVRELFLKLKQGRDWCQRNQHSQQRIQELFERSEPIFLELENLGVARVFSEALLIFGSKAIDELVKQFKPIGGEKIWSEKK